MARKRAKRKGKVETGRPKLNKARANKKTSKVKRDKRVAKQKEDKKSLSTNSKQKRDCRSSNIKLEVIIMIFALVIAIIQLKNYNTQQEYEDKYILEAVKLEVKYNIDLRDLLIQRINEIQSNDQIFFNLFVTSNIENILRYGKIPTSIRNTTAVYLTDLLAYNNMLKTAMAETNPADRYWLYNETKNRLVDDKKNRKADEQLFGMLEVYAPCYEQNKSVEQCKEGVEFKK